MNCREFELEWAGLDDTAHLTSGMEEHRAACDRCSDLVADLTLILDQARELRRAEEPPQRVWVAVRNQLEAEGLIREPVQAAHRPAWKRPVAGNWLVQLVAYAGVFCVTLGVMYVHSLSNPQVPPLAGSPQAPDFAYVRPDTSERDKTVEELLTKVPEDHREVFVTNWNQVNSSINSWQSFVEQHPEDTFAPQQLLNARQQKEQLWENLLRWDEF